MSNHVSILCICGSGVVTSSMVANRLKDQLGQKGFDVEATEANPSEVEDYTLRHHYDLIAAASPVDKTYGVPKLNAISMVTGINSDAFIKQAIEVFKKEGIEPKK